MPSNPRQFQTMYLRAGIPVDQYIRKPAGAYYGFWDEVNPSGFGVNSRYMGPLAAQNVGGQVQIGQSGWAAIPAGATRYLAIAQFCSDPVEAVSIPAAAWRVSWAIQLVNASATFKWSGVFAVYAVNGRTGERRGTILSNDATTPTSANNDERTVDYLTTGLACELLTGHYLAVEIAAQIENTGGAPVVPNLSAFFDGTTQINSALVLTTSPSALLICPVPLVRVLPYPSEQPEASTTEDQARALAVAGFPPGILHEFDSPGLGQAKSPDAEFMDWIGTLFKRFGFDYLDIWQRELDPARANLKLDDWRDLYEIIANPAKRSDLAALVIARLREIGQGSTLFGIAASVGTMLGYASPPQLEIIEYSASTARTALQYSFPIPVPLAVPALASYAGALTLITPYPYDGGIVWSSGAWMSLDFNASTGKQLHVRLTAPDGYQKEWNPVTLTHEVSTVILFAAEMSGHPVRGNWTIEIYREIASPVVTLTGAVLYAPGMPRSEALGPSVPVAIGPPWPAVVPNADVNCGSGRHRQWWGVYADPALLGIKTASDFREARAAISRIRHGYQRGDLLLTKSPIPGTPQAVPGECIPG